MTHIPTDIQILPFSDVDGDYCMDFRGCGVGNVYIKNIKVKCVANANGFLQVPYTIVWSQSDSYYCDVKNITAGTSAKCIEGYATVQGVTVSKLETVTDYHFDECEWDNLSYTNEVVDSSNNGYNGNSYSGGSIALNNVSIGNDGENAVLRFDDVDDAVDVCGQEKIYPLSFFNINGNYNVGITVSYAQFDGNEFIETCTVDNYKIITVSLSNDTVKENYKIKSVKGNFHMVKKGFTLIELIIY